MYGSGSLTTCSKCGKKNHDYVMGSKSKTFLCAACGIEEDPPTLVLTGGEDSTILYWPLKKRMLEIMSIRVLNHCGWFARRKIYSPMRHAMDTYSITYHLEYYGSVICPAVQYNKWPISMHICGNSLCELREITVGMCFYT